MTELLNCPFCGGPAIESAFPNVWRIDCRECEAESRHYDTRAKAIAAWNRRPPSSEQAGDYRDAYEGAREDLLDWKGRAQRAEATLRSLGYYGIEANEAPAKPCDAEDAIKTIMVLVDEFAYVAGQCGAEAVMKGDSNGRKAEFNGSRESIEQAIRRLSQPQRQGRPLKPIGYLPDGTKLYSEQPASAAAGSGDPTNPHDDSDHYCRHCPALEVSESLDSDNKRLDWIANHGVSIRQDGQDRGGQWFLIAPYHTKITSVDDHKRFPTLRGAIDAAMLAAAPGVKP